MYTYSHLFTCALLLEKHGNFGRSDRKGRDRDVSGILAATFRLVVVPKLDIMTDVAAIGCARPLAIMVLLDLSQSESVGGCIEHRI